MAMGNLHRVAGLRRHGLNAHSGKMGIGGRGQNKPVSQAVKKMRPQDSVLLTVKGPLQPHRGPVTHPQERFVRQGLVNPCHMGFPYFLTQCKKVCLLHTTVPGQLIPAALPPPDALAPVKIINFQFALVVALGIRPASFFSIRHAVLNGTPEPPETGFSLIQAPHPFVNTDGGAIGAQHFTMPGHDKGTAQHIFKRGHHTLVQGGPPQKHHPLSDFSFFNHPVQVIMDDGVAQSGNQIIGGNPFLMVTHQIRFHEHRAPFSQFYRCFR